MISAAYLYSLCQALDLRVMQIKFLRSLEPTLRTVTEEAFPFLSQTELGKLHPKIWTRVIESFSKTATMDSHTRFKEIFENTQPSIIKFFTSATAPAFDILPPLCNGTKNATERSLSLFLELREAYSAQPDATPFLGRASKRMYLFVRRELRVPFHRGLVDHPASPPLSGIAKGGHRQNRTTGNRISAIYEALRSGRLCKVAMECVFAV
jgi:phenylalanine ammonia-lyase